MSAAELKSQQRTLQAAICAAAEAPVTPAAGLAIYQNAYSARLIDALRDNYTVLHLAMGDEAFDALAAAYLAAQPSRRPSIRWFGDQLADFMAGPYAEALPHPSLTDFARMDWALRGAFDAASGLLLQAEDLQALAPQDWPALVFDLQPHVRLLDLDWAIEPAWRALQAEDEEVESDEPQPHAHSLLVWRAAASLETRWRSLDEQEAALIQAVSQRCSFTEICEKAAQTAGEQAAATVVVRTLQSWLSEGLLMKA